MIENDGRYLYILSGAEILIVDAGDPSFPVIKSRTHVSGTPKEIYLHKGRLTVISTHWKVQPAPPRIRSILQYRMRRIYEVEVRVLDLSDPSSPQGVSTAMFDGSYSDSRMVDGKLVLILQNDLLTGYRRWAFKHWMDHENDDLRADSFARFVKKTPVNHLLPCCSVQTFGKYGAKTTSGMISEPQDIFASDNGSESNLVSVVQLRTDGESPGIVGAISVIDSFASSIHMNATSLYLFLSMMDRSEDRTQIRHFDISGDTPQFVATGSFEGRLLNQFSADATEGLLRFATNRRTKNRTDNAVRIFETAGDTVRQIGAVEGIAPGERITSARFIADRAYLVTFEQVDPLFTIDLSAPASPKILGELKIPGFSRYLQPYGAGYLLGIGRDADPGSGRTLGLKLALFDVRDDTAPRELANYLIPTPQAGWSWSEAEWDHHALGFFPELGIVAVPVEATGHSSPSGTRSKALNYEIGLQIFHVSADSGIRLLGMVSHDSPLLRSTRIGDVIFSIALHDLKAVEVLENAVEPKGFLELLSRRPMSTQTRIRDR